VSILNAQIKQRFIYHSIFVTSYSYIHITLQKKLGLLTNKSVDKLANINFIIKIIIIIIIIVTFIIHY